MAATPKRPVFEMISCAMMLVTFSAWSCNSVPLVPFTHSITLSYEIFDEIVHWRDFIIFFFQNNLKSFDPFELMVWKIMRLTFAPDESASSCIWQETKSAFLSRSSPNTSNTHDCKMFPKHSSGPCWHWNTVAVPFFILYDWNMWETKIGFT